MVRPTKFEITQRDDRSLAVAGELDMHTAPSLAERVEEQVKNGVGDVTLDLRELSFMDSSGLRLLIELDDRARTEGWALHLITPRHEAALLVLRATGADTQLPFQDGLGTR